MSRWDGSHLWGVMGTAFEKMPSATIGGKNIVETTVSIKKSKEFFDNSNSMQLRER